MKYEIKLKRRHPIGKMRLGRHTISMAFQEFDLNEKEIWYVNSKGGLHWFECKECEKPVKKVRRKKVTKKEN